jgi:hypothetical protein
MVNDTACAEYLEKARWGDGFVCPHCGVTGEPFRIATRPGVLACRKCRRQTGLTARGGACAPAGPAGATAIRQNAARTADAVRFLALSM